MLSAKVQGLHQVGFAYLPGASLPGVDLQDDRAVKTDLSQVLEQFDTRLVAAPRHQVLILGRPRAISHVQVAQAVTDGGGVA